jgi:hypothetical protein
LRARLKRLHDDRVVPSIDGRIGSLDEREEQRVAVGQQLWTVKSSVLFKSTRSPVASGETRMIAVPAAENRMPLLSQEMPSGPGPTWQQCRPPEWRCV